MNRFNMATGSTPFPHARSTAPQLSLWKRRQWVLVASVLLVLHSDLSFHGDHQALVSAQDFTFDNNILSEPSNDLNEWSPLPRHHGQHHQTCAPPPLETRVRRAQVIFTGTVRAIYHDYSLSAGGALKAQVEIKRVMKGSNIINNLPGVYPGGDNYIWPWHRRIVMLHGVGAPRICGYNSVRKYDTRVFMAAINFDDESRGVGGLWLNSTLIRLTLRNIEQVESVVRGVPFTPAPTPSVPPCERKYCAFGAECIVNPKSNEAECKCKEICTGIFAPVCGSDGVTYSSECNLRVTSCSEQKRIRVDYQGSCDVKDPCKDKRCSFGAQCVPSLDGHIARCQCPERCDLYGDSVGSKPVCGTDGMDYANTCELRKASCTQMKEKEVKYEGKCDPCDGYQCPMSQTCQLDEKRRPACRCDALCNLEFEPVCGSDGRTYSNECIMRVEACKARREIRVLFRGECSAGNNPCDELTCQFGQECHVNRNGHARCVCPPPCEPVLRPVCGSDDKTYDNECELTRQSCLAQVTVYTNFVGECTKDGPCSDYDCNFGAICVVNSDRPSCECPTCTEEFEPVCGTDGISYTNDCKLKAESCEKQQLIELKSKGLCSDFQDGCAHKQCDFYSLCESDGRGHGVCVCPSSCVTVENLICGTDGVTYSNECELKVSSCQKQQLVVVASRGPCDKCANVKCRFGAECQNGKCVCPESCPLTYDIVCASDGESYNNECLMRVRACAQGLEIDVVHSGECEADASGSGVGDSAGDTCDEASCRYGGTCDFDAEGQSVCMCNFNCKAVRAVVCGSDGKTYGNECQMREESCKTQVEISVQPKDNCDADISVGEELCDGEPPITNPGSGWEYDCRPGKDICPPKSYCHRIGRNYRCCKEEAQPIRSCRDTKHGCCSDRKTSAPGPGQAGCPSVCQCNSLGSYGTTCEPNSRQCYCKPGVGGLRCDRCEPGYWGLPMIAEGNSGCMPCNCNVFGSVRDDCEQMNGNCVCKPGIQSDKCDRCRDGSEIGPHGCTGRRPPDGGRVPRSCDELRCRHGATCVFKRGRPSCECPTSCQQLDAPKKACGTDGNTYSSTCQMRIFSCRLQKDIGVAYDGPCRDDMTTPRSTTRSRKTTRHVDGENDPNDNVLPTPRVPDYGIIGDICMEDEDCQVKASYCRNGLCACKDGLNPSEDKLICDDYLYSMLNDFDVESAYFLPSFSGMESYLQLKRFHHANRDIFLEISFNPLSDQGILLFVAGKEDFSGDFIALVLKDGYVEFRYDLGSGSAILKSRERVTLNQMHKVKAKRFGKDGMLQVDQNFEVTGVSPGTLRSLNLATSIYLGYVPNASKELFAKLGVSQGLSGCVETLRVESLKESHEYDLMYPGSPDVEHGQGIGECSTNPCGSMPCRNGGTCLAAGTVKYSCLCGQNFVGTQCDMPVSLDQPCHPNPCQMGGTCIVLPEGGSFCSCPQGRMGDRCQEKSDDTITVPEFNGASYLELPMTQNVGRFLSFEIWFRSEKPNGVLLYSSQAGTNRGDFISVNLLEGFLQFRYNLGSGSANLTSDERLSLNTWHRVEISRTNRLGSLVVDGGQAVKGMSGGNLRELNLPKRIWVGGYPGEYNPESGITTGLHGAIQRIFEDGRMIEEFASDSLSRHGITQYSGPPCPPERNPCMNGGQCQPHLNDHECRCAEGYTGRRCEMFKAPSDTDRPIAFDGNTHHKYQNRIRITENSQQMNRYELRFRSVAADGLLLLQHKSASTIGDFLAIGLHDGHVEVTFNLGKEQADSPVVIRSEVNVQDGLWHTLLFEREKRKGTLAVDSETPKSTVATPGATQLDTDGYIWLGGSRRGLQGLPKAYDAGLQGCIDTVTIDNGNLDLVADRVSHGLIDFCDVIFI